VVDSDSVLNDKSGFSTKLLCDGLTFTAGHASATGSGSERTKIIIAKERKAFLNTQYKKYYVKGWDELQIKLMQHGGEAMLPTHETEDNMQLILNEGRIFDNSKLMLEQGTLRECHQNACRLWAKNNHLQLVRGYALYKDLLWIQHS
jgi:hypothetical protein